MKTLLITFTTLFIMATNLIDDFKLPSTWDKDFTINVAFRGSMRGGSTEIKFTRDSCTYIIDSDGGPRQTLTYALKEKDRRAILEKLRSLKIDKIDSNQKTVAVRDGWSQSICFGFHCIEGGPSIELSEKDKSSFLTAYGYLEQFASDKAR